jgi:glutamine cyclotransferase
MVPFTTPLTAAAARKQRGGGARGQRRAPRARKSTSPVTGKEAAATTAAGDRPAAAGRGRRLVLVLVAAGLLGGGAVAWQVFGGRGRTPQRVPLYGIRVNAVLPHDKTAYAQGLCVHDGTLYESTGRYGDSTLRQLDLKTGEVISAQALPASVFGEGLAVFEDRIYQLTWKAGICYVYDLKTLKKTGRFTYRGEGWGLTHDGTHLIMSNGSDTLTFRDPKTFAVVRRLAVRAEGRRMHNLNELEYIGGEVWANVYMQDYLVRIDPQTGTVTGRVDCRGLLSRQERWAGAEVLNGIAYDGAAEKLYLTGKNWPKVFQVELTDPR